MSEPSHGPAGPGKGQIKIPGIGRLPAWFVLGGGALVLVLIIRHRSSSAAAAPGTSTDPAGNTGVIDPQTGYVYGSPQDTAALATSAASTTPNSAGTVPTSITDQVTNGPPFTSNAAWAQYAVSTLQASGYDPGTITAELGLYLNGQPVTSSQETDINAAIAVAGWPPVAGANGQPPAINVSGSKSGGGPGSGGGGGGSGSPGTGAPITVIPVNLHTTNIYSNSVQVAWLAPTIPANQGPLTGYGCELLDNSGHPVNGPFDVGKGQLYANFGGLKTKTYYHVHIWCIPATPGGPHAVVSFTTK